MELSLIAQNVLYPEEPPHTARVSVSPEEGLLSVCARAAEIGMVVTFDRYYEACGAMMASDDYLPYLIRDGRVLWNVPYREVTVGDFAATHQTVADSGLYFEYGHPAAGGPDWIDVWTCVTLWAPFIWEVLVHTGEAMGIFKSARSLTEWLRKKYGKERNPPYPMCISEFIFRRELWNHHELAALLQIEPQDAKEFLRAYGYRWEPSKQAYCVDAQQRELIRSAEKRVRYLDT